jgi:hypothetical protein
MESYGGQTKGLGANSRLGGGSENGFRQTISFHMCTLDDTGEIDKLPSNWIAAGLVPGSVSETQLTP